MSTSPQQNTSARKNTSRGVSKISIIVWIALVLIIGTVLWACLTESGLQTFGTILDKGVIVWLFGEGNLQEEADAAAALEKIQATVIKEGDKGVTSVGFGIGPAPDDETLKLIGNLIRLQNLCLSKLPITDDQLAYFSKLNKLSGILLNGTKITDDGLHHLVNLPSLQCLYANNTKISDKGLEQIGTMINLTILDLSCTDVTDKGMKDIAKLKNLNWLLIWDTKVTEEGLADVLTIAGLTRLTLSTNMKISPEAIDKIRKKYPNLTIDFDKPVEPESTPPTTDTPAAADEAKENAATTAEPDKKAGKE